MLKSESVFFTVFRYSETIGHALFGRELPQLSSRQNAVIHRFHVAGDEDRLGCGLIDLGNILLAHDDGAETDDLGIAAIQNDDIRLMRFQDVLHMLIPDRVTCQIERLLIGVFEYYTT